MRIMETGVLVTVALGKPGFDAKQILDYRHELQGKVEDTYYNVVELLYDMDQYPSAFYNDEIVLEGLELC